MQQMKGPNGIMVIKIDLDKAYDCINWDFLLETLNEIGLNKWLIDIIWQYVSPSNMHILWNGFAIKSFIMSHGLR